MPFRHALWPLALASLLAAASGPELVVSLGHAGAPDRAVFVGPYIATASWSNVALIDAASGLTVARLPQRSLVLSLDAGRTGRLLAVGTCGHAVNIWNVQARTIARTLQLPQECANSISFSPDEGLLVTDGGSCCLGSAIQVWDVRTGALVRELARGGRHRYVVFGGDGRWIGAVDDSGRATIFEWPSGRQLRAFAAPARGQGRSAAAMTSLDGRYFGWRGEDIHVWDVTAGEEAIEPVSGAPWFDTAAFLDDGRFAYVQENTMVRVALPHGTPARTPLPPPRAEGGGDVVILMPQQWLAIHPDGIRVVGTHENTTTLWSARGGSQVQSPSLNYIHSLQWSRGGLIAWRRLGSGLRGWDARRGRLLTNDVPRGWLEGFDSFGFSPEGTRVAVFATGVIGSGSVQIREASGSRIVASRGLPDVLQSAVAVGPLGLVAFASGKDLALFDDALRKVRSLDTLGDYASAERLAFSPDGRWLAAGLGGQHTFLRVYEANNAGSAVTLDTQDVTYGEEPPTFSSDSRWLASVVRGKTLTIWSTGTWNVARTWILPGNGRSLSFSPSGARLAIAAETEAAIWDAETGRMLVRLVAPDGANISEIAWSPDAQRVVTAGDDGVLRFWDAASGRLLCSVYILETGSDWLLVSSDGRLDGTEGALKRLVAWRTGERVARDEALTRRYRVRDRWAALR
jgi:WD40 repeat protein